MLHVPRLAEDCSKKKPFAVSEVIITCGGNGKQMALKWNREAHKDCTSQICPCKHTFFFIKAAINLVIRIRKIATFFAC